MVLFLVNLEPINLLLLVSRSNQWLGRSNWGNDAYMKGRFDDFRIYVGELTLNDVALIYNETAPPVAGTVNACMVQLHLLQPDCLAV